MKLETDENMFTNENAMTVSQLSNELQIDGAFEQEQTILSNI